MKRGFGPDDLLAAYATGVFPMADGRDDPRLFLVDPEQRGVLPLERFHVPRRLARTVRSGPFDVTFNQAFRTVVEACAAPAPDRPETWINATIVALYDSLARRGDACSVECWRDGALVGGLYGVRLGRAFFGESMFSIARDASKVALVHLAGHLCAGGFALLDAQFLTSHLARFGAEEWPRSRYLAALRAAIAPDATGPEGVSDPPSLPAPALLEPWPEAQAVPVLREPEGLLSPPDPPPAARPLRPARSCPSACLDALSARAAAASRPRN